MPRLPCPMYSIIMRLCATISREKSTEKKKMYAHEQSGVYNETMKP